MSDDPGTDGSAAPPPTQSDTPPPVEQQPDTSNADQVPPPQQSDTPPPVEQADTSDDPTVDEPSNDDSAGQNVTYAIGTPGQHPRLIFTTSDPAQAQQQEQSGEVCFAVQTIPAEPYAITADGMALETVAPQLVDVQRAARLAARAAYEGKVAFYQSSVGLIQTDEASQDRLMTAFLNAFFFYQPNDGTGPDNTPDGLILRWRLADNSFSARFADLPTFQAFVKAALGFGGRCLQAYWAIVDQIQTATTNDAVAAIDVTAGYPLS